MQTATLFGGSGFIGKNLIEKLLKNNFRVKIITRDQEKSACLKTFAGPDFLSIQQWDYQNYKELDQILHGSDVVINLVGILTEKNKEDFKKYHTDLAKIISEKCKKLNVEYVVHLSALGIDDSANSKYAQSKLAAEKSILKNFPKATVLRPSIIFGAGDNFFNKFAKTIKSLPFLPLINSGKTKFQPIYVEDVADIILKSISSEFHQGKIYEIGGDKTYSFKELMEFIGSYCNKENRFMNLTFKQAKLIAFFLEIFTKNILTRDQVELLKTDNVLSNDNFKKDFNIHPKPVEEIVPNYIS